MLSASENIFKRRRLELIHGIMAPGQAHAVGGSSASISSSLLLPASVSPDAHPSIIVLFQLPRTQGTVSLDDAVSVADDAWYGDIESEAGSTSGLGPWTTLNTCVADIDGTPHAARTFVLPDRASNPAEHAAMVLGLTNITDGGSATGVYVSNFHGWKS